MRIMPFEEKIKHAEERNIKILTFSNDKEFKMLLRKKSPLVILEKCPNITVSTEMEKENVEIGNKTNRNLTSSNNFVNLNQRRKRRFGSIKPVGNQTEECTKVQNKAMNNVTSKSKTKAFPSTKMTLRKMQLTDNVQENANETPNSKETTPSKKRVNNNPNEGTRVKQPSFSTIKTRLRTRSLKNYEELSLNNSSKVEDPKEITHLPIYKQSETNEKDVENKEVYEFDSDSEKPVIKKKRKRKLSETHSEQKEKTGKKKRKEKKETKPIKKYDEIIENILRNAKDRILQNGNKSAQEKETNNNQVGLKKDANNKITNSLIERKDVNITLPHEDKSVNLTFHDNVELNTITTVPLNEHIPENTEKANPTFATFPDTPRQKDHSSEHVSRIIQDSFGFIDNEQEAERRINIISAISLKNNVVSDLKSGMNIPLSPPKPWRFNSNLFRSNPYNLNIKQSSLPSLTQDLILTHAIVAKFEENTKKPRQHVEEHRKSPVQKTLHDYFGNKENKENIGTTVSLFDEHQLSPLKINGTPKKVLTPKNSGNAFSTPLNTNFHKEYTPNFSIIEKREARKIHQKNDSNEKTYFGFENETQEKDPAELVSPFRAPSKNVRKYRASHTKNDTKVAEKSKINDVEVSEESGDSEEHDDGDGNLNEGEVQLFEDIPIDIHATPKRHGRKPNWMKNMAEPRPKRKRRDERTKSEEEEAENWARSFNEMCEEVERFPLEIE